MSVVHSYSAYGRLLHSEIALPELAAREAAVPEWTVRRRADAPPGLPAGATVAGSEHIYDAVHATLVRHDTGWRIIVDDTGTFDWDVPSRTITCWRQPEGTDDFLRAHLLGRVLGTVLHDEGLLVLHGSAVVTPTGVIGFLGPKGYGKSSLALALAREGASMLTDDTLALTPSRPHALPGILSTRLHPDSAGALGIDLSSTARDDGKHVASLPEGQDVVTGPVPVRAIYLLLPVTAIAGDRAAAVAPLPATSALAGLVSHAKVGEMLGRSAAPDLLRRAAALMAQVPVQGLAVTRDLARLAEAAQAILTLDGAAGPPPAVLPSGRPGSAP